MPLSGDERFVIMTRNRTKPERKAEEKLQRQKEKRIVPVGVCNDLIQGITKVSQSPGGTVKRLKIRTKKISVLHKISKHGKDVAL